MDTEGLVRSRVESLWESFVQLMDKLDEQFSLREKFFTAREYAYEHPVATLFALVAIAMCSIPVMGFVCFVISTVLLTFLGFIFFEGSLLLFGLLILGGMLCFTGIVSVAFSSCLVLSYLFFNASCNFLSGFRGKVDSCYEQYSSKSTNGVEWRMGGDSKEE